MGFCVSRIQVAGAGVRSWAEALGEIRNGSVGAEEELIKRAF